MSVAGDDRLRELAMRAGLRELQTAGLLANHFAACGLVMLAGWRFWPRAPEPELGFDETAAAVQTAVPTGEADAADGPVLVVVHVAGAVMRPGVYSLSPGARVADALDAAGGARAGAATDAVNLARVVTDGEQIYVPTTEESARGLAGAVTGASAAGGQGKASSGGLVDINRASSDELESLPGVGPATAQKIVEDREKNGPFTSPEDLMRVPGIGPKKFESLKDLVTCG